jgi:pimeloyl-ACP methyl ester carboxylesterase
MNVSLEGIMTVMIRDAVPQPRTLRTAAGRTVGYYDFGDPGGEPVLALHGTPASGAGFVWADAMARELRLRLLAPDRAGIGLSDVVSRNGDRPNVAAYASELFAFADALHLESFLLLGYSGGGPYALAAAHADRDRIRALALVSCAGQVGVWATRAEFDSTDRMLTRLALRAPALARATVAASAWVTRTAPAFAARIAEIDMSASDRKVMSVFPSSRAALGVFSQAVLRGTDGVIADYVALAYPWGFPVEQVRVPVRMWHGDADVSVPFRHSQVLASRVPNATLTTWPGEGHLAIISHGAEVLDGLVALGHH